MIKRGVGIAVNKPSLRTVMEEVVKRMVDSGVKNPKIIKTAVMLARRQIIEVNNDNLGQNIIR